MPSREFPAPPDLSELLKFFESDEGKARVSHRYDEALRAITQPSRQQSSQAAFSKRLSSGSFQTATSKAWRAASTIKPAVVKGQRISQPPSTANSEHKTFLTSEGWNASTQLPPAPVKTLRHQLLCRTYQPPAPVLVVPSDASGLLDRLAKGTISSRSKLKTEAGLARGGQNGGVRSDPVVLPHSTMCPDTRARDAIQTLLFYRKEVEKRRRLDTDDSRIDE